MPDPLELRANWLICINCGRFHGDWEAYCHCGLRVWREATSEEIAMFLEMEERFAADTAAEADLGELLHDAHATGLASR